MVNSATADAFRPGVSATRILRLRAAATSMFTGPPASDGHELQSGQPLEHSGGEGCEMGDGDLGAVHMRHHFVSRALIFLQPLHSRLNISMLHRLIRPGHLMGSDLGSFSALPPDRSLKHAWQHEAITDDGDDRPRTREVSVQAAYSGLSALAVIFFLA